MAVAGGDEDAGLQGRGPDVRGAAVGRALGGNYRVQDLEYARTAGQPGCPAVLRRGCGQGRGRTADLPIFSRTLVPTELPGRACALRCDLTCANNAPDRSGAGPLYLKRACLSYRSVPPGRPRPWGKRTARVRWVEAGGGMPGRQPGHEGAVCAARPGSFRQIGRLKVLAGGQHERHQVSRRLPSLNHAIGMLGHAHMPTTRPTRPGCARRRTTEMLWAAFITRPLLPGVSPAPRLRGAEVARCVRLRMGPLPGRARRRPAVAP